jgi:transposase
MNKANLTGRDVGPYGDDPLQKSQATKVNLAGIDVSAKTLDVAIHSNGQDLPITQFNNNLEGHQKLIQLLTKRKVHARVVLEATGSYSLGLALVLADHPRSQVMVANPRAMKSYAEAIMQRGKSDPLDAGTILDFCKRMDFVPWARPAEERLVLRGITRRIRQLTGETIAEKNRLHAKGFEGEMGEFVIDDVEVNLRHLKDRVNLLKNKALDLIKLHEDLKANYDLLLTIKGVGVTSALHILGELMVMPEDMTAPQWVACAGLDPRICQSGTSLDKAKRISKAGNKYLRAALYMPAMTASNRDPNVQSFYRKLVDERGKKGIVALVAVMRKLLHAIWGMFRHNQPFDGTKFHPLPVAGGRSPIAGCEPASSDGVQINTT